MFTYILVRTMHSFGAWLSDFSDLHLLCLIILLTSHQDMAVGRRGRGIHIADLLISSKYIDIIGNSSLSFIWMIKKKTINIKNSFSACEKPWPNTTFNVSYSLNEEYKRQQDRTGTTLLALRTCTFFEWILTNKWTWSCTLTQRGWFIGFQLFSLHHYSYIKP